MRKIRIAVIGCGAIAQMMHIPYLQRLRDRFELVGLCDISAELARAVASRFGVSRWTTDYHDLLDSEVDAALVLTGGSHGPICLDLARAGKHIFVEKPLCYTLAEGEAIEQAVQASGVTLMVGYMKRFDPGYGYARQAIVAGSPPQYLQVTVLHPEQDPYMLHHRVIKATDLSPAALDQMRADSRLLARKELGDVPVLMLDCYTNLLLGSLVHDMNATRHLVGEPVEVLSAQIWNEARAVSADLRFASGFVGHYSWVYLHDLRNYSEEIGVYSSEQRVTLQFPSPYLAHMPTPVVIERMDGEAHKKSQVTVNYEEAFERELIHFHESVATGSTPITDLRDGMQDVLALKAIAVAALTGRPQPIPTWGGNR